MFADYICLSPVLLPLHPSQPSCRKNEKGEGVGTSKAPQNDNKTIKGKHVPKSEKRKYCCILIFFLFQCTVLTFPPSQPEKRRDKPLCILLCVKNVPARLTLTPHGSVASSRAFCMTWLMVSRSERISARFLVPSTFRNVVAASKRVE